MAAKILRVLWGFLLAAAATSLVFAGGVFALLLKGGYEPNVSAFFFEREHLDMRAPPEG